jgi:Family of unknown function (DUF5946)
VSAGCQALAQEMAVRGFSDCAYARVHRLAHDTYCVQHPDSFCISAKSLAAHRTGLCWALEYGGHPTGYRALQCWLDGTWPIQKPGIPTFRGAFTIADVYGAVDAYNYAGAVEQWAFATWEVYMALHPLARRWVEVALVAEYAAM